MLTLILFSVVVMPTTGAGARAVEREVEPRSALEVSLRKKQLEHRVRWALLKHANRLTPVDSAPGTSYRWVEDGWTPIDMQVSLEDESWYEAADEYDPELIDDVNEFLGDVPVAQTATERLVSRPIPAHVTEQELYMEEVDRALDVAEYEYGLLRLRSEDLHQRLRHHRNRTLRRQRNADARPSRR